MSYRTVFDNYAPAMIVSLPRYLFSGYKRSEFTQEVYGICKEKIISIDSDINEDAILGGGICSISNQLYLPPGDYVGDIATKEPVKVMESIASLLYHLMLGDVSTSYQLIDNISLSSYNSISENKFSSPVVSTNRKVKVKAWTM
ncbi:MAG: hypothetical protein WC179_08030 [Candidatus Cloacimonadaceae bacterium]